MQKRTYRSFYLSPKAFYLALFGLILLSLAMCDTAIRLDRAISQNPGLIGMVYIPALEHIFGGAVVLSGGVLLIDFIEKH